MNRTDTYQSASTMQIGLKMVFFVDGKNLFCILVVNASDKELLEGEVVKWDVENESVLPMTPEQAHNPAGIVQSERVAPGEGCWLLHSQMT